MVKYALSMALILLLGTCGDRGAGPETGRIALDVQDPAPPDEASGTVVQGADRMVVTVLQNETVVMSEDLRYEGGVWLGELTVSTGSYSVVVEAYKGAIVKWRGSALVLVQGGKSSRVVIALTSTNQVPVLADIGDQTIAEGRTLTILLVGTDADGDALAYVVEGAPTGSSLSGSTFTWEPSHTQAGEYSVTFTVADEHGGVARETIIITVGETNQAPTLAAIGDQTVAEGSLLTIPLVGTDEDGDALTYAVEGPPAGAALSGSTFTWEPSHTQAGEYSVTFTVTDEHGGVARETIIITVGETNQAPTLAAIGDQTVAEGSLLTITLDGTDVDEDALTYSVVDNPAGSSLSEQTFRWTPSPTQAGEYSVTFTVADEYGGVARETIIITVGETNQAPTLAAIGDQTVAEGSLLTIPLVGTDEDGDALTYAVEGPPAGAALSGSTFTWEPSHTQAGEYSVTFTVTDEHGGVARETIIITVGETNQAPTLAAIGDQTVAEGSLLTITLDGTDVDEDALTYSVVDNPAGSSLSEQTFRWTPSPTQAGEYSVTFTVADEYGGVARETIIITVGETNQAPTLAAIGDQTVAEGSLLTIPLVGTDEDGDALTYAVEGPPAGAALSGSTFTWEPSHTQAGEYSVTFTVADEYGGVARETIIITVGETNQAPELADVGNQNAGVGKVLTIILEGSDVDGDELTYSIEGEPTGASLSEQTFSWKPSSAQVGTYEVTFTVEDGRGGSDSQNVTINVEANQIPELAGIGHQTIGEGKVLMIILEGSDGDGDELTYSIEGEPAGASLSEQTFSWKPSSTQVGTYEITFTVEDGRGGSDSQNVTINVEANQIPELASIGPHTAEEGSALTIILEGSDADGDALTYAVEKPPTGAVLSEQTFRWTPSFSQSGEYEITFTVEDGRGGIDRETVTITVGDINRAPELATIGDQTVDEASVLTITLADSDADGDALTLAVEGQPEGSSLSGRTFRWTPSYSQAGEYEVTFTVEDGRGGIDRETITITVRNTNREPELAAIGDQTVVEGHTLTITLAGSDADGDVLTYTVEDNPPGSSLSGATFTWQPSDTEEGMYQVTFKVEDEHGGQAIETIVITVQSRLRRLTNHDAVDGGPSWSPDGSQIAFHSDRDGSSKIYVMDAADGSNPHPLIFERRHDEFPSWSPDGTQIAFQDGSREIYVMDADGSNPRQLTSNSSYPRGFPSWSPDGTQIAFHSSDSNGNWEIYVMDADGSNPRQLTSHSAVDRGPSWSPDGSQIAFHSDRDGNAEIYVMDADGSNSRRLTRHNALDAFPSWSPDGSQIAFHSDRDGNWNIYVMDADGSNPRQLTSHSGSDLRPSWSPDGSQIAFESDRDGNVEIYVLDLQGE